MQIFTLTWDVDVCGDGEHVEGEEREPAEQKDPQNHQQSLGWFAVRETVVVVVVVAIIVAVVVLTLGHARL